MAFKTFANGYPLTASELNTYLMNQSVMVFATASARSLALTSPTEGMVTFRSDDNKFEYYDGAAWVEITGSAMADKSANYSIVAGDRGKTIRSTGSAITVTIDNVLPTAGDRIDFIQAGTGQITFAAGSGVTLSAKGGATKTSGQYAAATVIFAGSGVYYLIGSIA